MHIHSTCSDGILSPSEILYSAKEKGLAGLSITDHDIFAAYTECFFALAKQLKLEIITGIEMSSEHEGKSIHVLGYDFKLSSISFLKFIRNLQKIRYERNLKILEKLKKYQIYIEEKELYVDGKKVCKGRPQIAKLIVAKKKAKNFQKAFDLFLKEGASCYVAANKLKTEAVIEQIHKAQGKAVLAHPHQIKNKKQVLKLLDLSFDGIEVFYGRLPSFEEEKWLQIAKKKNLLITGGSDFHGIEKTAVGINQTENTSDNYKTFIGSSWIDDKTLKQLLKK